MTGFAVLKMWFPLATRYNYDDDKNANNNNSFIHFSSVHLLQ
jgi:hypothetical protein